MAQKFRPPLSRPSRYLGRMMIFLILSGFIAFILHRQILTAFQHNPGLNGLIIGVMVIGILLALQQVIRLFPEIKWVNELAKSSAENPFIARPPLLLAPMAAVLSNHTQDQPLSIHMTRSLLDSVGSRLDEGREIVRYLAGLLIFLGLLGTFWGLIETVGSVGDIIGSLSMGENADALFNNLKEALSKPLQGMGLSFSASLFGLAGSLILGFLDLQAGQAQNRFYTELEDWLSAATTDAEHASSGAYPSSELIAVLERLERFLSEQPLSSVPSSEASNRVLMDVADSVKELVESTRSEQLLLRGWMETQAERDKDFRTLINLVASQREAR